MNSLEFLNAIFPEVSSNLHLPIWTMAGEVKRTYWCKTTAEAAAVAEREAQHANVYFGVSLQDKAKRLAEAAKTESDEAYLRGTISCAGAIGGFWSDIDFKGDGHKAVTLPTNEAEAMEFLRRLPIAPTLIVRTGGGLHVYWLFEELWVFESDAERVKAQAMIAGWQKLIGQYAELSGWSIDSTKDLARVLRVAETYNRKPHLREPYFVTAEVVGGRYDPSDFEEHIDIVLPREGGEVAKPLSYPANEAELQKRLSRRTLDFLQQGAKEGERDIRLFIAACDLAGNGLATEEADRMLRPPATRCGLSDKDVTAKIASAFSKPRSPAKHQAGDEPMAVMQMEAARQKVRAALVETKEKKDAAAIYAVAGDVAKLPANEVAAFKTEVKDALGARFNIRDFNDELRKMRPAAPPIDEEQFNRPENVPYRSTPTGFVHLKPTRDGTVAERLCNFTAQIEADTVRDDGAERQHVFDIRAMLNGRVFFCQVPASRFASLDWVLDNLGAGAIVNPGFGVKEHTRVAIQKLSREPIERTVFTHIGWREINGQPCYLHAGGAIGKEGPVEGVRVDPPEQLSRYVFPAPLPPGDELTANVRASLRLADLADDSLTIPSMCAVYRAPLGTCDGSPFLAGPSGARKSEFAGLLNSHFGKDIDRLHLPANWTSTPNSLEALAFAAKDALLTIDDFAPAGSVIDQQRQNQDADRVLRAQGNSSGRQRMRADGSLRPSKPPRGVIVSTGEDVPKGHSLRARLMVLELGPSDIDLNKLTACQADATSGRYVAATSAYIKWLAGRVGRDGRVSTLQGEVAELRLSAAGSGCHLRTPELVANLAVGFQYFLDFALDVGAISQTERSVFWSRVWKAMGVAADRQAAHQSAGEPTRRFLDLLSSAISSGSAHVAGTSGEAPANPSAHGWRSTIIGTGTYSRDDWRPQGARVGWVQDDQIYLEPAASLKVANEMAAGSDGIALSVQTLGKRLDEKGLLIRKDGIDELRVRKTVEGSRARVWHLRRGAIDLIKPGQPGQPAENADFNSANRDHGSDSVAGFSDRAKEPRLETRPINVHEATKNGSVTAMAGVSRQPTPSANGHSSDAEASRDPYEAAERAAIAEEGRWAPSIMEEV